MTNARMVFPKLFDNENIAQLDFAIRYLYIGLVCNADKEGRMEDRPQKIKKTILGYDNISANEVDAYLDTLQEHGFIIRYEASGQNFIQIVNFTKYQPTQTGEPESVIPCPEGYEPPKIIQGIFNGFDGIELPVKKQRKVTVVEDPVHEENEVPFVSLHLKDDTFYPVYRSLITELQATYGLSVERELKKMSAWLEANPKKRKTRTGIRRFINSWLSRLDSSQSKSSFENTWTSLQSWIEE